MFKALLRSNKLESRDHPPRRVAAAQPIGKQESGDESGSETFIAVVQAIDLLEGDDSSHFPTNINSRAGPVRSCNSLRRSTSSAL
jgi:hypothetical protein